MRAISRRITDWLIRWRNPLMLLGIAAAAVAYVPSQDLTFDRSIESMFAPDDPLIGPYEKLKRVFGGNEVVLAVYEDQRLFHSDGRGIERLARLSRQLKAVAGVKDVISIDQPLTARSRADDERADTRSGPRINRIVDTEHPLAGRMRDLFEGYTHSGDGKTAAVVCLLVPVSEDARPTGGPSRREVIDRMRRVIEQMPGGMLAGEPVMVADGFRYVEEDGKRLAWASTALLSATVILCFRSLRWMIVPIAVVQLTLLLTRAALVWCGLQLSMVSSMLTAIVTVVGIATVVHVIVRFRDGRTGGLSRREALAATGRLLAAPVFWACSTDAVGFASLRMAEVGPVRDFGTMMAIGSLLVVAAVALVLPGLVLWGRRDPDPKWAWGEFRLQSGLDQLAGAVRRRPRAVGLGVLLLVGVAASGAYRLEVETDFTKNFRAASPIVRSYEHVEARLGGAGVWDVILPAPPVLEWSFLRRVRRLENRLRDEVTVTGPDGRQVPGLTKVLSLADAVVANANTDPDRVRFGRSALVTVSLGMVDSRMPILMQSLYGQDPEEPQRHYSRIMLRARERQPAAQRRRLIEEVTRICREEFPPSEQQPGAEVTGFFVLLTNLIDSMVRDQWRTFGVATGGIGLMMVFALRSPLLAVIALVPNILPIAMVTGLMGWLGIKINMGAAMIAAVSMGLSIDSSIHYVTAFRRARSEGKSLDQSLADVQRTVGRAMVFSTLALMVGFTVLCTSQFVPTIYFGVLVSLSMLGGLAGNLIVLPLLLSLGRGSGKPIADASP